MPCLRSISISGSAGYGNPISVIAGLTSVSILTSTQARFLARFFQNSVPSEPFYLSGGTALAEYYLQHRFSDDLDFFTRDRANFASANNRVREAASAARLAISDVVVGDYSVRYRLDGDVVTDHQLQKVEFLYDPAPYQRDPSRIGAALVDSLLCIAIKKVDALHNRTEIKDFIDFYLAVQKGGYSVTDLIAVAKAKNGAIDEWEIG